MKTARKVVQRFMRVDPLASDFPSESPFIYAGNNPIINIDVGGMFKFPAHLAKRYAKKYPLFTKYLQENIKNDVLNSSTLVNGLLKYSNGELTQESIANDLTFGNGPNIIIADIDGENLTVDGKYREEGGEHNLYINEALIAEFEKAAANPKAAEKAKTALLLGGVSTVLHEYVHYGDRNNDYGDGEIEEGHAFEAEVYTQGISNRPFGNKIDIRQTMSIINLLTTGKYNPNDKTEPVQSDKIDPSVLPTLPNNN